MTTPDSRRTGRFAVWCVAVVTGLVASATYSLRAGDAPVNNLQVDVLTEESLGDLLKSMGLKPEKNDKRYDFAFKARAPQDGEEWKLSMSTVLSQNGRTVWVMAWLDKLPGSAEQVPRTALLRLLAANDQLGKGKFFAYIPANKRFVLQRVIPNKGLSTRVFQTVLQDLGYSVVDTYPAWNVARWTPEKPAVGTKIATPSLRPETRPVRTSTTDSSQYKNSTIK